MALERILLGDTEDLLVDKINRGLAQTDTNKTNIETLNDTVDKLEEELAEAGNSITLGSNTTKYEADENKNINLPVYNKTEVDAKVDSAGKVNTVSIGGKTPIAPDANKNVDLPVYSKDEVDAFVGELAGGMRYKGTLGTDGTITSLPTSTSEVENGDTYKVVTAGTYASQEADIGDLFTATVSGSTVTWHLVPSGDDGDVYANETLTNGNVVVGGGQKLVKPTNIPLVRTVLYKILIIPNQSGVSSGTEDTSTVVPTKTYGVATAYQLGTWAATRTLYPVGLFDSSGNKVVTAFKDVGLGGLAFVLSSNVDPTGYYLIVSDTCTLDDIPGA